MLKNEGLIKEGCSFYELDFDSIVQRKTLCIEDEEKLSEMLEDRKKLEKEGMIDLVSKDYFLLSIDLRNLDLLSSKLKEFGVDFSAPTLFFAECVMTYMKSQDSSNLIEWTSKNFEMGQFVCYEHINPHSAFGNVMQSNLSSRNSPLIGVYDFPTKESQRQRYLHLGYDECNLVTMLEFYENSVSESEKNRIASIDEFDEFEEWNEKCSHYFILWANKKNLRQVRTKIGYDISESQNQNQKEEIKISKTNQNLDTKWLKLELEGRVNFAKRWGQTANAYKNKIFVFGGYGGAKRHSRYLPFFFFFFLKKKFF